MVILVLFFKTGLKSKEKKKDPINPKSYDRKPKPKPKKYKETNSEVEENKNSYVTEEPDRYDTLEHYGSAQDLFAHAFSYGKRNRRH